MELMTVRFENAVSSPADVVRAAASFECGELNAKKMATVADAQLYRNPKKV